MSISRISLLALAVTLMVPSLASAQYYTPPQGSISHSNQLAHQPGGAGFDLGLREGVYPSVGAGIGQVGFGLGAGGGAQGVGSGVAVGAGPLGGTGTLGLNAQGLGTEGSFGWDSQTGVAFDAGVSENGLGFGGRAELFGFGTGGSIGVGRDGPDLGASVAFGPIGTLQLGRHAKTHRSDAELNAYREYGAYPGYRAGFEGLQPGQDGRYYQRRAYGQAVYYLPSPPLQSASTCPSGWTC